MVGQIRDKILIRLLDGDSLKIVTKSIQCFAPRVGDEIRLSREVYYKVKRLIWCYDEPEAVFARLNIEVELIEVG